MKAYVYIGVTDESLLNDGRVESLFAALRQGGAEVHVMQPGETSLKEADILLSVGGDGTFLAASALAAPCGVPVVGVNLGRLGFLSENRWQAVGAALASGDYTVENRTILHSCISACTGVGAVDNWPYALNEVCVHRTGASMLAVDVTIDGTTLPTYWADGLLVATSSGSTAYSLSVGGPIVLPESKGLIISPISPHNLNVRPLIVPDTTEVRLKFHTRDSKLMLTLDNRSAEIDPSFEVDVKMAQFSLKRIRLNKSNFIQALSDKLYWGEDVRNND
jgi:NAD+ kinase